MPLVRDLLEARKKYSRKLRKAYKRWRGHPVPPVTHYGDKFIYEGADGAAVIRDALVRPGPALVARFGWNELATVKWFMRHSGRCTVEFLPGIKRLMGDVAGFINPTDANLTRFSCELLAVARDIDVLGVWFIHNEKELCLHHLPREARLVYYDCLNPLHCQDRPWTGGLEGRKVLVIHPFEESVRRQYGKRRLLFANPDLLPEFELKTLKAYQSVAGNNPAGYPSWFAALAAMKAEIDRADFDVALVGAGAYGMFLAHHCRRIGKKAVYVGGALQLMFGIKGARWEQGNPPTYPYYNEHWVRPLASETPDGIKKVEDGCYW